MMIIKKKFRKLVINKKEYYWTYHYDDYDYIENTYLLILPLFDKKAEIYIIFEKLFPPIHYTAHCMTSAFKNGESIIFNLNQPKFTAEFIDYIMKNKVDFTQQKRYSFCAENLLKELGYEFEEGEVY